MAPKVSPTNLANAVRDYLAGEGCESVAARYGTSQLTLRTALVEHGLWRSPAEMADLRSKRAASTVLAKRPLPTSEIVERYLRGESPNALAKSYCTSRRSITNRLEASGVPIRGSREANRLLARGRTPAENAALMLAAQAATRGVSLTLEHRCNGALARERSAEWLRVNVSEPERQLCRWLEQREVLAVPQKAIGPYNVDLAANTVAVEIFGGGWHGYGNHRRRAADRLRYILDQGWNLMIVWTTPGRWPLTTVCADEVVSFMEIAGGDPPLRGQHRVIWGDGKPIATVGLDVDDLSAVPARGGRQRPRS